MVTDDVKLVCLSRGIATLLKDLKQTFIYTDIWGMQLKVAYCQHFDLDPGVASDLNISNNIGGLSFLPHLERISNLGVVVDVST